MPSAPGYVTSAMKCVGRGDLGCRGEAPPPPSAVTGPRGDPGAKERGPAAGSAGGRSLRRGRQAGAAGSVAGSGGRGLGGGVGWRSARRLGKS